MRVEGQISWISPFITSKSRQPWQETESQNWYELWNP